MSGAGRKHRAKHLTRQYLDDDAWCGLLGTQQLAVSTGSPSGKHLHVLLFTATTVSSPIMNAAVVSSASLKENTNGAQEGQDEISGTSSSHVSASKTDAEAQKQAEVEAAAAASSLFVCSPAVVHLPGKFHKVMWIAAKDVLVVVDNVIERKLSPAQLENFYETFPAWKERIQVAALKIEEGRQLKGAPTVGFGPSAPGNNNNNSVKTEAETNVVAAAADTEGGHQEEEEVEEQDDDAMFLENPNRGSIKHRQMAFLDDDDEEEEEEEEDDE